MNTTMDQTMVWRAHIISMGTPLDTLDGATSENERLSAEIERLKKENELLSKLLGPMFGPKVHRDQNEIP
jgi:archaellum component FlaC